MDLTYSAIKRICVRRGSNCKGSGSFYIYKNKHLAYFCDVHALTDRYSFEQISEEEAKTIIMKGKLEE